MASMTMRDTGQRRILQLWLFALLTLLSSGPAAAAVELAFYSREMGSSFPHAFATMKGTRDSNGESVDASYGFTAISVTPAILMGSVKGEVVREKDKYIEGSDRQFSIVMSDAEYDAAMGVVERWRTAEQPSYNLNRRNCVHFVGEIAQALGLQVAFDKKLMKKPRSFLLSVKQANQALLESRAKGATMAAAEVR